MSLHIFANIVTPHGIAANNRADNDGNITTLQKLLWHNQPHSTVSAEAIRFAIRRVLLHNEKCNRNWAEQQDEIPENFMDRFKSKKKDEKPKAPCNFWDDPEFSWYSDKNNKGFIDDDLLGFMRADEAQKDGSDKKGSQFVRRAVIEITRAISLTSWPGDVTFNAASPGATISAQKGGYNPAPYGTEVHATRYQYGLALTPERLRDPSRAAKAIRAIGNLRTVAGNHGRFLYDFSPDAIVLRITDDPAPRLLYCFDTDDDGKTIHAHSLLSRIEAGDVLASELILGVSDLSWKIAVDFKEKGVEILGVKAAIEKACGIIDQKLAVAG